MPEHSVTFLEAGFSVADELLALVGRTGAVRQGARGPLPAAEA